MQVSLQPRTSARLGAVILAAAAFGTAHGQTNFVYKDVHDMFQTTGITEEDPVGGVVFDASGNAFGTNKAGGDNSTGTLWEFTAAGSLKLLHSFGGTVKLSNSSNGTDGFSPICNLTMDGAGNLYGTATIGGITGNATGFGMVWEYTSGGSYKDLHDFGGTTTLASGSSGNDGQYPDGGVAIDSSGDVFGTTTEGGGHGKGIVWEIPFGGSYKDIHDFGGTVTLANGTNGTDGEDPVASPTVDSSGNLYGTTFSNGLSFGMVWEITTAGTYKDLHDFGRTVTLSNGTSGQDGLSPYAGVTLDSSGNLYGCTTVGAGSNNAGMVWKLTTGGAYIDLHDFGGTTTHANGVSGLDGISPYGTIAFDSLGNMFGTTQSGGPNFAGNVWEITAGGAYVDQHDFGYNVTYPDGSSGPDGENPFAGVTFDPSGNIWGTTSSGSSQDYGIIFKMFPIAVSSMTLSPSTIIGGYSSTGTITLNTTVGSNTTVEIGNQWQNYVSVPATVTVPSGSSSVTFTASVSKLYSATFTNLITATLGSSSQSATLTVTGEKLSGMTVSPTSIGGFDTSTGTITITNPAPTGGWVVNLKSALPTYVAVPTSVTVAAGTTTATFTLIGLGAHDATVTCKIYATDVASGANASITLQGDSIAALTLNPSTIGWDSSTTGTVTLTSAAPPGGWVVNLTAGASGYLTVPTSVTVPVGSTSTTFSIVPSVKRSTTMSIRINASDGATGSSAMLKVEGDSIASMTFFPTSIGWAGLSIATVTLTSPAPVGGWIVNFTCGAPGYFSFQPHIQILEGQTTGQIEINPKGQYSFPIVASFYASDGNSVTTNALVVTGDTLTGLSVNPTSVTPGQTSTGTVTLSSPAPQGGWVVKLTSGAPSLVSVPTSVTVPAGATGTIFTITTPIGAPATSVSIIANDGTSQEQTTLTIT